MMNPQPEQSLHSSIYDVLTVHFTILVELWKTLAPAIAVLSIVLVTRQAFNLSIFIDFSRVIVSEHDTHNEIVVGIIHTTIAIGIALFACEHRQFLFKCSIEFWTKNASLFVVLSLLYAAISVLNSIVTYIVLVIAQHMLILAVATGFLPAAAVCNYLYSTISDYLSEDSSVKNKTTMYPCPVCSDEFRTMRASMEHECSMHGKAWGYVCEKCEKGFASYKTIQAHKQRRSCARTH